VGGSIFPMVPGHEIVGRVSAVGARVKKFKVNDLAAIGCLVNSCRECENCKKGLEQYCRNGSVATYNSYEKDGKTPTYGGYSSNIVADEDFVLRVPDNLKLEAVAPLLCAGITTYSPLRHWKVGKGHKVGVLGLGGLGHMAVKFASSFGAEVTMLSTSPGKEADAKRLGAEKFCLTSDNKQTKALKGYFDFIVDTVSAPHDYNLFLSMLSTNGIHICVGAPPSPSEVSAFSLIGNRRSIAGSLIGGLPETQEMLDYCSSKEIVSDVEVIAIRDINAAYERMMRGDVRYRFVIDMSTL
jgi:alcohol dehydrogenase (NADP+)